MDKEKILEGLMKSTIPGVKEVNFHRIFSFKIFATFHRRKLEEFPLDQIKDFLVKASFYGYFLSLEAIELMFFSGVGKECLSLNMVFSEEGNPYLIKFLSEYYSKLSDLLKNFKEDVFITFNMDDWEMKASNFSLEICFSNEKPFKIIFREIPFYENLFGLIKFFFLLKRDKKVIVNRMYLDLLEILNMSGMK